MSAAFRSTAVLVALYAIMDPIAYFLLVPSGAEGVDEPFATKTASPSSASYPPVLTRAIAVLAETQSYEHTEDIVTNSMRNNPLEFVNEDVDHEYVFVIGINNTGRYIMLFGPYYQNWDKDVETSTFGCPTSYTGASFCAVFKIVYAALKHRRDKDETSLDVSYPWIESYLKLPVYKTSRVKWVGNHTLVGCGLEVTRKYPEPLSPEIFALFYLFALITSAVMFVVPGMQRKIVEENISDAKTAWILTTALAALLLLSSITHDNVLRYTLVPMETIEMRIVQKRTMTGYLIFGVSAVISMVTFSCRCSKKQNELVMRYMLCAVVCALGVATIEIPNFLFFESPQTRVRVQYAAVQILQLWMAMFVVVGMTALLHSMFDEDASVAAAEEGNRTEGAQKGSVPANELRVARAKIR